MAKENRLTRREIDRIYTGLRPRLKRIGTGGGTGGTGTIAAHTHPASAISFEAAGDLAADDVQEALEEVAEEKLARDGHQPMTGDLDLDHYDITNIFDAEIENDATVRRNVEMTGGTGTAIINGVRNVTFNGDVGEGIIDLARVIHMTGAASDDEGKIDGLERLVFNNTDSYSKIEALRHIQWATADPTDAVTYGDEGWDSTEHTLVVATEDVMYGDPEPAPVNTLLTWGWNVTRHKLSAGGEACLTGHVLMLAAEDADYSAGGFPVVTLHTPESLVSYDLGVARRIVGLAMHPANPGETVWVMRRGRLLPTISFDGGSSGPGTPVWASVSTNGGLSFTEHLDGQFARVLIGHLAVDNSGEGPFWLDVDVRPYPTLMGASWVKQETPVEFDVLRFNNGDYRWERAQLHPSTTWDTGSGPYSVTRTDYLIRFDASGGDGSVVLPSPGAGTGQIVVVKKIDDTDNHVRVDAVTNGGTVDGDDYFDLVLEGESLTVQSDGSSWAVI